MLDRLFYIPIYTHIYIYIYIRIHIYIWLCVNLGGAPPASMVASNFPSSPVRYDERYGDGADQKYDDEVGDEGMTTKSAT